MRHLALIFICLLAMTLTALAADWSPRAPEKPVSHAVSPPADPEVLRQGGDTIADAVAVPIPYEGTGTTVGYNDDYEESCPYPGTAPDVVYMITPAYAMTVEIDLCGSSYDTKVWVYDENLAVVACNDDFYGPGDPCGDYVSKIEALAVAAGAPYYVIVDGYADSSGDYAIAITEVPPCIVDCPAGADLEGEPPLTIDYVDEWNGGCASDVPELQMQPIVDQIFCGVSGWYLGAGANSRDTDWFLIDIPAGGVLEIIGDAEYATYMFELGPQDCADVGVLQQVTMGPCTEGTMTITGSPGSTVWFWVGPTVFASPDGSEVYEYTYTLRLNLDVVATESMTFSEVKGLFD